MLVVGRFLALLELYREAAVAFEQITPLGDLTIRWTGNDTDEIRVTDEFDEERPIDLVAPVTQAAAQVEAQDIQAVDFDESDMKEQGDE